MTDFSSYWIAECLSVWKQTGRQSWFAVVVDNGNGGVGLAVVASFLVAYK